MFPPCIYNWSIWPIMGPNYISFIRVGFNLIRIRPAPEKKKKTLIENWLLRYIYTFWLRIESFWLWGKSERVIRSDSVELFISRAMASGRTVKDVSPHEFVKAYASHLKRSGKVSGFVFLFRVWLLQLRIKRRHKRIRWTLGWNNWFWDFEALNL